MIPWRGGCPHRERAWRWVRDRYREYDFQIILAHGPDPWIKAEAVMPAIEATRAETIIVADADVWTDELLPAVEAVEAGEPWAIPHKGVHRLTEAATADLYAGKGWRGAPLTQPIYKGIAGGGIVVAKRETFLAVPLDPRFVGWGGEDQSWGLALHSLLGAPHRGDAGLVHLYHPPQGRLNRRVGSMENNRLYQRYVAARRNPNEMSSLLEEARLARRNAHK